MTTRRKNRSPFLIIGFGIFWLAVGIACSLAAWDEIRIKLHSETAIAQVIALREIHGRHGGYQVRYHFHTEPSGTEFSASDLFRGQDSYIAVNMDGWREA